MISTSTILVTLRLSWSATRFAAALTAGETRRVITAVFLLPLVRGIVNYSHFCNAFYPHSALHCKVLSEWNPQAALNEESSKSCAAQTLFDSPEMLVPYR